MNDDTYRFDEDGLRQAGEKLTEVARAVDAIRGNAENSMIGIGDAFGTDPVFSKLLRGEWLKAAAQNLQALKGIQDKLNMKVEDIISAKNIGVDAGQNAIDAANGGTGGRRG